MFSPKTILEVFSDMELIEFSYIHNYVIKTLRGEKAKTMINNNVIAVSNYDCGIFIFTKR